MQTEYDDIRAWEGEEIGEAMERVIACSDFAHFAEKFGLDISAFHSNINSIEQLDKAFVQPFFGRIEQMTTRGIELRGKENIPEGSALFLSNHRDIILDSAFLSMLLRQEGRERPYIAIGNNLYGKPWIEDLVRANRAFTVVRNTSSPRELLQRSQVMSAYMRELICKRGKTIWMAQRSGRAKDSDDRTQDAILKMLAIGQPNFMDAIRAMNICPVAISYEYDPCDYLKAWEMQMKRDHADYKKSRENDLKNMMTGLTGRKGKVVFTITPSINLELDAIEAKYSTKNEQASAIAALIDRHIFRGYEIFHPADFDEYIDGQLAKIEIENKDEAFLRECLLAMYRNPEKNQMQANKQL